MIKKKTTREKVLNGTKRRDADPDAVAAEINRPEKAPAIRVRCDPEPEDAFPEDEGLAAVPDRPKKAKKKRRKREKKRATGSPGAFLKSKPVWAIISICLALVIAFVIMPAVEKSNMEMVPVVAASQGIPEGTKIESSMLQTKEYCKTDVPTGAVQSSVAAVGKYAVTDLMSDDILTSAKIGDTYSEDAYLNDLPDGKMAMSVELSDMAQSVSGKLRGILCINILNFLLIRGIMDYK